MPIKTLSEISYTIFKSSKDLVIGQNEVLERVRMS